MPRVAKDIDDMSVKILPEKPERDISFLGLAFSSNRDVCKTPPHYLPHTIQENEQIQQPAWVFVLKCIIILHA